jgi:hypothetical protein
MMPPPTDAVAAQEHVTVLVRLLLDRQGQLVLGEMLDLDGQSVGAFRSWATLGIITQAWFTQDSGNAGC